MALSRATQGTFRGALRFVSQLVTFPKWQIHLVLLTLLVIGITEQLEGAITSCVYLRHPGLCTYALAFLVTDKCGTYAWKSLQC